MNPKANKPFDWQSSPYMGAIGSLFFRDQPVPVKRKSQPGTDIDSGS